MNRNTTITVPLKRSLSVKVDWASFATNLADVAAQGFITAFGIDGISGGISALINVLGSVKSEDDAGENAWRLFWLSFAWSLDELRSTSAIDDERLRRVVKDSLDAARVRTDAGSEDVPVSFLTRPTSLPIYKIVRDEFVARRSEFRLTPNETAPELSARFDSAFSRAVSEIWIKKPDSFKALASLIQIPGDQAAAFEDQWAAYRNKLIHDFEVKPMFGQEDGRVSLSQSYIPLRCQWRDKVDDPAAFVEHKYHFDYLDSVLINWVDDDTGNIDSQEEVKLVGGGPGSGKSTSLRHLARVLADRPDVRPLLIPLQHLDLEGSLRDAINNYFTSRTRGAFTMPPLSRNAVEDGPKLVLLFDGLDEIARPGEGADEVANLFVSKLNLLQSAIQGDAAFSPKIVVTGRLPSFQAARRFRGASGHSAVEVVGYAPCSSHGNSDYLEITSRDQRPIWWQKFAPSAGLNSDIPLALSDQRLNDVTNEPLLCYLLVLSGFAIDDWEAAAENRNLIYQRLINEVWARGWGDANKPRDRQGPGKHLTKVSFNDLMETIALSAWLGGDTRVATEDSFHSTLKITHAEEAWAEFKGDGGEDVANLAMNFYLKSSEGTARGFEFTHKSFGDYLAARAILRMSKEVMGFVPRYTDQALQLWMNGTGSGTLTTEILNYMRDEVRLEASDLVNGLPRIRQLYEKSQALAITVIDEGFLPHSVASKNWRAAARMQKNAEVMLWAVLHSCIAKLHGEPGIALIDVGFDKSRLRFKNFLLRIGAGDDRSPPIGQCLSYILADKADVFALDLSEFDFSFGSFRGANFNGCHLMSTNLSKCDLEKAMFQRASLDKCIFEYANIEKANFIDSRPLETNLFKNTSGVIFVSRRTLLDFKADDQVPADRIKISKRYEDYDQAEWLLRTQEIDKIYTVLGTEDLPNHDDDVEEFEDDEEETMN
ncbi:pentapeptide repeat-containing protein [Sphingomonas sp. PAMC 26621]|uniref:pentapeptide repeat-containing protein n=1 Tax=Sphingomonas sp. PAMC 26621 TaxID=1112213 RepID=UPI00030F9571|nr:pentapeptide repeat-containing protein [Sphingomonas sp. PAMC 26621]